MKKLIPILFFIFLITSCEKQELKEPTYCWKCDMYSYWDSNRIINTTNWCDMTVDEIIAKEKYWEDLGFRYDCIKR